jgi:hypothetical protein
MKKLLVTLTLLCVLSNVFAAGSSVGNLRNPRRQRDIAAMGSGYYDTRNLTIAADTITVDTSYSGMMLIGIKNETDADMTIYYTTDTQPDSAKDITLPAYGHSGLMPSIHTILDTTAGSTGGKTTLFFWNLTN